MYARYARRRSWRSQLLEEHDDPPRLLVLRVWGKGVERLLGEGGIHKVQHKTRSRRQDRIHTSVVTVAVLEPPAEIGRVLRSCDVRIDTFRGSGAGGQHRNVTDSAVRAVHTPTGETATVTSGRSQGANRDAVIGVLAARLQARHQDTATAQTNRSRQRQAGQADRAGAGRVYDRVRDMVRMQDGRKVQGVERVLSGDLDKLI